MIFNGDHTNLTCFISCGFSNIHGNKLTLWSLLEITAFPDPAIRESCQENPGRGAIENSPIFKTPFLAHFADCRLWVAKCKVF